MPISLRSSLRVIVVMSTVGQCAEALGLDGRAAARRAAAAVIDILAGVGAVAELATLLGSTTLMLGVGAAGFVQNQQRIMKKSEGV
jgi:hypothetical protein